MQIRLKQVSAAMQGVVLAMMCASCTDKETQIPPQQAEPQAVQSAESGAAPIDFAALDRLVGEAQFVILGEDSHRMPAIHRLVGIIFRHLVEEKGFRNFVFEAQWGLEDAMNGFLASSRAKPSEEETFLLNAFFSEPILDLLLWAREYNAAHPGDPMRFTGYQPEQPVTDAVALRALAAQAPALDHSLLESALGACDLAAGQYADDQALLAAQGRRRQKDGSAYAPQARAGCLAALDELERVIETERETLERQSSRAAVTEAQLHVLSIRTFVGRLSPAGDDLVRLFQEGAATEGLDASLTRAYFYGDKARFEIFEGLRQMRDGGGKTFLWMHNGHAARRTVDVVHSGHRAHFVPLGARFAQRYGKALVAIATIVPCEDCDEPAGSLEPAFARRFGDRTAVVDFSDPAAVADLPLHTPGILFAQYHRKPVTAQLENIVLDEQFDGVIYLPNAETLP